MAHREALALFSRGMSEVPTKVARLGVPKKAMAGAMYVALLGATGCVGGQDRCYALYPATDPPPPREQLARLTGYVQFVDGQDVAPHGSSFDMLPGCHVIGTPKTWGGDPSVYGGWIVDTGRLDFVMPMKPGYFYSIEVQGKSLGGRSGRFSISAVEKDGAGNMTRKFRPVPNAEYAVNCPTGSS